MQWINEPPAWSEANGTLSFDTGEMTDFWRETHYGFVHDNGHLYGEPVTGDFSAEVVFAADYSAQYDQAGLMLRYSPTEWVKAGIEFAHGEYALSVVITHGRSDWSVAPVADGAPLRLRMTRTGGALCVQWAPETGGAFRMLRLGAVPETGDALVGPMACSPSRAGLQARFRGFAVLPAVDFANAV